MSDNNYTPVEDGWKNGVKPCFVEVNEDHFNENSLNVELTFDFGDGMERPKARIPLVYAADHKIITWKDGNRSEHTATAQDQRDAYALLGRIFPAWCDYCRRPHQTIEKIRWFEEDGRDDVLGTEMDIRVWHSGSGFPNATVKDPANAKPKKEKITKSAAIQRAATAFAQVFGPSSDDASAGVETDSNGGAIPF